MEYYRFFLLYTPSFTQSINTPKVKKQLEAIHLKNEYNNNIKFFFEQQ